MRKQVGWSMMVFLVATLLSCAKKAEEPKLPPPEPTPLFKPAMSYWNLAKAQKELNFKTYDTLEDRKPLVSDKRPPFQVLIIRVPNFRDHGVTGDLVLHFYNDRLMKTQFYVANVKEYLKTAAEDQQVSLSSDLSGGIPPHTKVWIGKEGDGRTYLGMEDEVLKEQMDEWIVRYSQAG